MLLGMHTTHLLTDWFDTAVLTVLTGCIASYGVLDRKPLDILRQIES